jgi:hypothetical protein
MIADARYLLLPPGAPLPDLGPQAPFVAFFLIRAEVTVDWQWAVSQWLVASGCASMAAWGLACTTWDDSVDEATLDARRCGGIAQDGQVVTSWHADDTLEEAFEFARHFAFHPTKALDHAFIIDISHVEFEADALEMWARA